MKKTITFLFSILLLAGCGAGVVDTTEPADAVTTETEATEMAVDLSGEWTGLLTHELVEGGCPPTPTQQGVVQIEQTGSAFTLQFGEGFTCSPAEACAFMGTIEGANYSATNGGIADNEGGTYTTSFVMTAMSAESAQAIGGSTYEHPAMRCEWTTSLSLTRGE